MKNYRLLPVLLFSVLSLPSMAAVDSPPDNPYKPHVGAVLGYGDINGEGGGAFNWGIDGGFQVCAPISIGIQATYMKPTTDFPGGSVALKRWQVLPKVSYNFGGETPIIKDSYIGVKLGLVMDTAETTVASVTTTGDTQTRFGFAPMIGFDQPLSPHVTLGAELAYLFVTGPEVNNDSFHALGHLKYWF